MRSRGLVSERLLLKLAAVSLLECQLCSGLFAKLLCFCDIFFAFDHLCNFVLNVHNAQWKINSASYR
jgi:hypothetical protein